MYWYEVYQGSTAQVTLYVVAVACVRVSVYQLLAGGSVVLIDLFY